MAGKLIIFSAPSGSGKSTIINYLLKQDLHLRFSISVPRGARLVAEMEKRRCKSCFKR